MSKTIITPAHPCFDIEAKHSHARVHLPVAPKCNVQCNYCNRQYDCVNESRPGVTSAVLSPFQALEYLKELSTHIDNISVIGIAGPGDPFASPQETIDTMRLIKSTYPDKIFCLSTNGLNLKPYIDTIADLGVTHVTITINAVNPVIGAQIYSWIRSDKKVYHGISGAEVLLKNQLECIPLLKKRGITVKINSIILPGINDNHIPDVAKLVATLGADIMNCIPVVPSNDTIFTDLEEPSKEIILKVRTQATDYIKMMTHCSRCRADAAGLLGKDFIGAFEMLQEFASKPLKPLEDRPYVAVATNEGMLVNMHLGEAKTLYLYGETPNGFHFVDERLASEPGSGDLRWLELAGRMNDCRALLVAGIGENPTNILQHAGIRVIQMTGLIGEGLEAVFYGKKLKTMKKADAFKCGETCGGNAQGCS